VPKQVTFTNLRDVFAEGTSWSPDALSVGFGETVTWHFDQPAAEFTHDLWLDPPGGSGDLFRASPGDVPPGGPPVAYTFRKAGAWKFLCNLHAGMTGTVTVGTDPGAGAGGKPPSPPKPPGAGLQPPPPLPNPVTAARLDRLPKTKLASFLRKGLRVSSRCESGLRGTVRVKLSRREARKLGLEKATTLASRAVRCGTGDTVAVRLRPSKRMKKALRKARGPVVTTVSITMGSGSSATSSSRRLVLSAPRKQSR